MFCNKKNNKMAEKNNSDNKKPNILGPKYVPNYQQNYFDLPWYERDLIQYFDYLDYIDTADNPDSYFKNKRVINFDNHKPPVSRRPVKKSIREQKTVTCDNFYSYPIAEEKKSYVCDFSKCR